MRLQKILIVEDEPAMVSYYTAVLEGEYDIVSTADGKSAIDHISNLDDIDLVLLDYKLPDMSGITVLREIKKTRPSIPVILITAYGEEEVAVRSFRCGVKEYLKKPVAYEELFETIRFCLSLKPENKNTRINIFHDAAHRVYSDFPQTAGAAHTFYNMQKAIQYVDENYMAKISLDIVAEKASMSRCHFSRIFKSNMGVTFQNYLTNRRMEKAKALLKSSRLTITGIAYSVGYTDITYFTKMFKRMTGQTPSQYKNSSAEQ